MCGYKFCRYERRCKIIYVPKIVSTCVPVWYQVTKIGTGCDCGCDCGCENDCGCNSNTCCNCNNDDSYCN